MSNDLKKMELEHRVRILLFCNRGSTYRVIEEYEKTYGEKITPEYVEKVFAKLKKEMKRDEIAWVGYHFAEEILSRTHRIQQILEDQYNSYEGQDIETVSECCHCGFNVDPNNPQLYRCNRCLRNCDTVRIVVVSRSIENLKLQVVDRMRKENEFSLDFLKELGFIGKPEVKEVAPKYLPTTVSNPAPKKLAQPTAKDAPKLELAQQQEVQKMDPREQQILVDKYIDIEFENGSEPNKQS